MSCKASTIFGCATCALTLLAASRLSAQEAEAAPETTQVDAALKEEIAYVEALIESGFPDFAEPVIAATKKKWPESDTMFFAIEIRGMLSLGKTEAAEAKIAALPDRKSPKYWAARLEVANNHYARGRKTECAKIYEEFFKNNEKPAKELVEFTRLARWQWGQILAGSKRFKEAADTYVKLLGMLNKKHNDDDANIWCNVACEAAELYLRLASEKPQKERGGLLDSAKKLIDQLLWERGRPLYFGRAIAMKAHLELLKGSIARAQTTIDDYMDQLSDIHKQIEECDPDGKLGLLKQSPMPQCRFLLAGMLWKEAQDEAKKPKKNDDRIASLLFGEKGKNGKRSGGGAYNHAINVFVKYPQSTWASQAGDLADEIAAYVKSAFGKEIKTNISKADRDRVRAMQFKNANEKLGEGNYQGAIDDYMTTLASYPEGRESVLAVENIVNAYLNMIVRSKDKAKIESWRLDADAVEGYLAERFGGSADKRVMTEAGDATMRIAAKEKSFGNLSRADKLYEAFLTNYRGHVNAAPTAASMGYAAQKEGRFRDALKLYALVDRYYTNSTFYATALSNMAICYEKLGDRPSAIAAMSKYVGAEKNELKSMQARMNLAVMYQKNGLDILGGAETNATPEEVESQLKLGSAQIIHGIKQFQEFADKAAAKLADPGVTQGEKAEYGKLREGALFLVGDCWGYLTKPEKNLEAFRRKCVESLEEYVKQYPKGLYAKRAYVKLGMIYTVLSEVENCKNALARLRQEFPESEEAKKAMPRLARNLIEYAKTISDETRKEELKKEATQIYGEMIRNEGGEYQPIDFVRAGESLIEARGWDLADQAFEKAIAKAGTNQLSTVARARLGKAKSLMAQKNYSEARESLDLFMGDEKMSRMAIATNACDLIVQVAMQQGRAERDETLRMRHYGAALGAIKKLRGYWKNEPVWKQDRAQFLMPADVKIAQVEAELAMGLDESAAKTRKVAAANLQAYLQSRLPTAENPIDKYSAEDLANLESAYAKMLPLLVKIGKEQAGRALKFGQQYLEFFPNGENRALVQRCINEAIALGAKMPEGDEAPAAQPEAPEATVPAPAPEPAPAPAPEAEAPAAAAAEEAPAPAAAPEAPAAEPAPEENAAE